MRSRAPCTRRTATVSSTSPRRRRTWHRHAPGRSAREAGCGVLLAAQVPRRAGHTGRAGVRLGAVPQPRARSAGRRHGELDEPVAASSASSTSIEVREDGGTPGFLQAIKAGLAVRLKESMGVERMLAREHEIVAALLGGLRSVPKLHLLAGHIDDRLGIISFYVEDLHYNLVVKLLNDRFGIQVRGGCSCAGTYGHYLLHVDPQRSGRDHRQDRSWRPVGEARVGATVDPPDDDRRRGPVPARRHTGRRRRGRRVEQGLRLLPGDQRVPPLRARQTTRPPSCAHGSSSGRTDEAGWEAGGWRLGARMCLAHRTPIPRVSFPPRVSFRSPIADVDAQRSMNGHRITVTVNGMRTVPSLLLVLAVATSLAGRAEDRSSICRARHGGRRGMPARRPLTPGDPGSAWMTTGGF